jgi:hypothetical protein
MILPSKSHPSKSHQNPIKIPWVSHQNPIKIPSKSHSFSSFSHQNPIKIPSKSHGFLMIFPSKSHQIPCVSHHKIPKKIWGHVFSNPLGLPTSPSSSAPLRPAAPASAGRKSPTPHGAGRPPLEETLQLVNQ